jgi:transcriptional antiterminator RfaH
VYRKERPTVKTETAFDLPCWYAVRSNPNQEERAHYNLLAWGVEAFTPRVKERRRNKMTGAPTVRIKPLFPRYIFARFKASSLLHKISYTRGVQGVVSFGGAPTPVEDEIIALIRAQIGEDGFVRMNEDDCMRREDLQYGDKVLITDGAMKDLTGIFERSLKDADRVRILLTTVSFQGHLTLDRESLQKVA